MPASHHKTMAAARQRSRAADGSYDETAWRAYDREALRVDINARPEGFGIDPSAGVELPAAAGSLVVFDPGCLHSSSENRSAAGASRYVVVQSFYHHSDAAILQEQYVRSRYLKGFHTDTHASVCGALERMLHGKALWGEAMREELRSFRKEGYFCSPESFIDSQRLALIGRLQQQVEPHLRSTVFSQSESRSATTVCQ
eukprot:SAG31_NODE_1488_length_8104_cov_6.771585_5_plen_199_part_00